MLTLLCGFPEWSYSTVYAMHIEFLDSCQIHTKWHLIHAGQKQENQGQTREISIRERRV